MVSKRNRILELKKYFSDLGINVNIGKTKARGHKGVFMHSFDNYRIDISKNVSEEETLSILLHEFAHYVHYYYDKKLKSLDFVFGNYTDELREELIKVTVQEVPKEYASELYNAKLVTNNEIKTLTNQIKAVYPSFKQSEKFIELERSLPIPIRYLLKYDNVKYFNTLLSVNKLDEHKELNNVQKFYLKLKSKQRMLKRITSRINRLNKYYNNPTELFARFFDAYYTKPEITQKLAPIACSKLRNSRIGMLTGLSNILK